MRSARHSARCWGAEPCPCVMLQKSMLFSITCASRALTVVIRCGLEHHIHNPQIKVGAHVHVKPYNLQKRSSVSWSRAAVPAPASGSASRSGHEIRLVLRITALYHVAKPYETVTRRFSGADLRTNNTIYLFFREAGPGGGGGGRALIYLITQNRNTVLICDRHRPATARAAWRAAAHQSAGTSPRDPPRLLCLGGLVGGLVVAVFGVRAGSLLDETAASRPGDSYV